MYNYVQVRPEHLNHNGFLFGGILLKWVDEFAWLAASMDFPGFSFVTVSMDKSVFKRSVDNGTILRFDIKPDTLGRTSMSYNVLVENVKHGLDKKVTVFSTNVKFVSVDKDGVPTPLPRQEVFKSSSDLI